MNLKNVRLTASDGSFVTLGDVDVTTGTGYTLSRTEMNAGGRQVFVSNLPLVAGGIVAPGRQRTRTVRLEGLVMAGTDQAVQALARLLVAVTADRGTDPVTITYMPEQQELTLEGQLTGSVELEPFERGPYMRYSLELECANPVAQADVQSQSAATAVVNGGDAAVPPVIQVTLSGTVTSLRVGSNTTGEYVQLDGLSSATTVDIDFRPGFELVEVDGVAALNLLNLASTFFLLLPGENDLYVTVLAGGGSASAVVEWRDGFLL